MEKLYRMKTNALGFERGVEVTDAELGAAVAELLSRSGVIEDAAPPPLPEPAKKSAQQPAPQ